MHVLLVEDDEDSRDTIEYFLARAGHVVRCAATGIEALGAVRHEAPDVVLLDVVLPALNGYEVCRLVKEDARNQRVPRRLPVVLVTARKVRDRRREMFIRDWTGADAVIYKPFDRQALLSVLTRVMEPVQVQSGAAS
ncbi:MAG TPA: response regulator [Candidatus Polarisedimenticolia bacterium]|jgi:CheY-like chemotaxis protein